MKVKHLIKELKELNPEAECVFAEYSNHGKTSETWLWYLTICCNTEHQEKQNQVWFGRNLLLN